MSTSDMNSPPFMADDQTYRSRGKAASDGKSANIIQKPTHFSQHTPVVFHDLKPSFEIPSVLFVVGLLD